MLKEGTPEWSGTGLENQGGVIPGGSIPLPSSKMSPEYAYQLGIIEGLRQAKSLMVESRMERSLLGKQVRVKAPTGSSPVSTATSKYPKAEAVL